MTTEIGFLPFLGFPMACLTLMIKPLRAASEISALRTFEWVLVCEVATTFVSSADISFDADIRL